MQSTARKNTLAAAMLTVALSFAGFLPPTSAFAQTPPAAPTTAALPEAAIRALQEALNKQGITVKTDGILNDETRTAIKKYQNQHHLPITGEPDKATLDKLGVAARQSAEPDGQTTQAQAGTTGAASQMMGPQMMQGGMMMPGGMMNCPMMRGQMQPGQMQASPTQQGNMTNAQMMQTMMQMMMGMMQMMQLQMQQGQPPAAQ